MNSAIAIEICRSLLIEIGAKDYLMRYRHFSLEPSETRTVENSNHLYVLVDTDNTFQISSNAGSYNIQDRAIREQQYIHTGKIDLTNRLTNANCHIKFIQLIPLDKNL